MNQNIIKPTSIMRAEFISSLTDLINNSSLPPFVIEPILKDFYFNIKTISQRQLEEDIAAYDKALSNFENGNTSENE